MLSSERERDRRAYKNNTYDTKLAILQSSELPMTFKALSWNRFLLFLLKKKRDYFREKESVLEVITYPFLWPCISLSSTIPCWFEKLTTAWTSLAEWAPTGGRLPCSQEIVRETRITASLKPLWGCNFVRTEAVVEQCNARRTMCHVPSQQWPESLALPIFWQAAFA